MMDGDGSVLLTGIVEADETYVGGKRRRGEPPRKRGRGTPKKPVFVAVQRGGEVRAAVMDAVTAEGAKAHLDRWADRDAALMTDELNVCGGLKRFWRWHFTVAHGEGEFHRAEDAAHVNTTESFNATFKRAHVGVFTTT